MKKTSMLFAAAMALGMASCTSQKQVSLAGEWDIVAVNGTVIDTAQVETAPFMNFDREQNQVNGSASCNSFFASMELDSVKSEIRFTNGGSTRMMCPYMEVEDAILEALNKVARYEAVNENEVNLTDAEGVSLMHIRRK